jgi:TetR/AcrR family transcriptional regulator, cholesterol catabolism regulator
MDIRYRIIDGASELFRTYGIKSVTMDSLANQLGMSKRTIYEVFSDKDELLVAVLTRIAQKQRELVKKVLDESENSIIAIFRMLEINRDFFQDISPAFQADLKKYHNNILMENSNGPDLPDYRNNQQVIENGIKEGLFRKEINTDLANRCLYNLGKMIVDHDIYPYELFSRRDVIENIFINYLRGISTQKGLDLIDQLERKF